MSRTVFAVILIFAPSAALAHVGHVGELAGHDHWIAIAAAGVAAAVWAAGKIKDRDRDEEPEDAVDDPEPAAES